MDEPGYEDMPGLEASVPAIPIHRLLPMDVDGWPIWWCDDVLASGRWICEIRGYQISVSRSHCLPCQIALHRVSTHEVRTLFAYTSITCVLIVDAVLRWAIRQGRMDSDFIVWCVCEDPLV